MNDDVDKAEAWDALSAKNAEITRLRANLRENYDAFSAMRNDINEMFGDMVSQEATLADGPTMSAECAAVVVAMAKVREQLAEAENQLDSTRHSVDVLEKRVAEAEHQRDVARAEALEDGLKRAAEDRATFCTAMPGTDEEFRAYLDGFDAAIRALIKEDRT